ncbi:helix-turn-helix domain-containing protein [Mycobacterium deserti]|uniref:Helix-turn-helix domain-containing protein n=1 Tax=Mycobacterium deserti TaxID=2978347 RepID=A0ABT2MCR1_9MYCO|nr:helix-turn-helix domain-containing protein [Mycobacterium deserti]MCT7660059.1 helix-turn-helix domain-containing protein [Mycobacterium deserti]
MSATFASASPHASLRGVAVRYEGYEERAAGPIQFRELPTTVVPIIIDLETGWSVSHRQHAAPLNLGSFVAGVTDGPVLVGHGGTARCLQVDLTPLGARQLIGIPMSELANQSVPIDDVLGRFGRDLVQRVGETSDWPTRFALVDSALRARLAEASPVDPGVAWSLRRITASGGATTIGHLAGELGWSHRRLIARYRDAVGLAPKLVARIVRFERLTDLLTANPAADWAGAATACGYFDQAHLAREVRGLADITPTELRAQTVNSVQDAGAPST